MSLDAQLVLDAPNILAPFGEPVIYTPYGGVAKTITAMIERHPIRVESGSGRSYGANVLEAYVANHPTAGVTSVKERYDTITVAIRQGGEAVELKVNKILEEDAGMRKLELIA